MPNNNMITSEGYDLTTERGYMLAAWRNFKEYAPPEWQSAVQRYILRSDWHGAEKKVNEYRASIGARPIDITELVPSTSWIGTSALVLGLAAIILIFLENRKN